MTFWLIAIIGLLMSAVPWLKLPITKRFLIFMSLGVLTIALAFFSEIFPTMCAQQQTIGGLCDVRNANVFTDKHLLALVLVGAGLASAVTKSVLSMDDAETVARKRKEYFDNLKR